MWGAERRGRPGSSLVEKCVNHVNKNSWFESRTFVASCASATCENLPHLPKKTNQPPDSRTVEQPNSAPLVDLKHKPVALPLAWGRGVGEAALPISVGSYASFCLLEYQMPHATCFSHFDFISVQLLIRSVSVWRNLPPVSLLTFISSEPGRQAAAAVLRCHPVTCSVHLVYVVMGPDEWMASHSTAPFMILSSGAVQLWFPSY